MSLDDDFLKNFGTLQQATQKLNEFVVKQKANLVGKPLTAEHLAFVYMVLIRIPSLCGIESQLTVMTDLSFNTQERCSFTYCE